MNDDRDFDVVNMADLQDAATILHKMWKDSGYQDEKAYRALAAVQQAQSVVRTYNHEMRRYQEA